MNILGPILFALIAAAGNALFAFSQKKAVVFDNPFTFIALAAMCCVMLTIILAPFFGQPNYLGVAKTNWLWAILSGTGLFFTYLGFNLLYSNYGVSSYILYAVLSIITTAVFVGVLILKESFNLYHWLALAAAIAAIVLFSLGNRVAKA